MGKKEKKQKKKNSDEDRKKNSKGKTKELTPAESIPYMYIFENGIIQLDSKHFSKSYEIPDINFKIIGDQEQFTLAGQYADLLGGLGPNTEAEITLFNKTIDEQEFESSVFIKKTGDSLDEYRDEYNRMLSDKAKVAKNNLKTVKILTVTCIAKDIAEASERFRAIDNTVNNGLSITKKDVVPMSAVERLDLLNLIYNQDTTRPLCQKRVIDGQTSESFTLEHCVEQGVSTKDIIAPSYMKFENTKGQLGQTIIKSFFVASYPTIIKGTVLTDFAEISTNALISVHFRPMEQGEAIKMIRRQSTNINALLVNTQKRAAQKGYDADLISPEVQGARDEAGDLMESMTGADEKLFMVNFVFTLMADSEENMRDYTNQLMAIAERNLLVVRPLILRQEKGFDTALPLGGNYISNDRMMTTSSVSAIIPFDVKELQQKNGMYYGLNALSHNMILYSRTEDTNMNACILGMPGAGKSFAAKREMLNVILNTNDEIYVIDPEREYAKIAEAMHGVVVKIANGSANYINPLDLNLDNADGASDPVKVKSDFVETLVDIMIGGNFGLAPIDKSIIGRSVTNIYDEYMKHLKYTGKKQDIEAAPTLLDLYNDLMYQGDINASNLAIGLERFVKGSLDIFSHHTNIDVSNRFIVYDIKDIGAGLEEVGLQICLDNIWNRMVSNFALGKRTWIYIDEFHKLMRTPSSAAYIANIWARARKWRGCPCAITQNVEDMLKSASARTVISNCWMIMLLNQSPINASELSRLLNISEEEKRYISGSKPGMGLLRINDDFIPFDDSFPRDTKLYKIMTTKPDERLFD